MEKSDYIYMIKDNLIALGIQLPDHLLGENLEKYLISLPTDALAQIAGFDKKFSEFFFIKTKNKSNQEFLEFLNKLTKISYLVGPIGELAYLTEDQVKHIFKKIEDLKIEEITSEKISIIADELLEQQFGGTINQQQISFENTLQNIRFYLREMGYPHEEVEQKIKDAGDDPDKLDTLFSLPEKTIYTHPPQSQQVTQSETIGQGLSESIRNGEPSGFSPQNLRRQVPEISEERAQKVQEIIDEIKQDAKDSLSEDQEAIFHEIHPDRLSRIYNILKKLNRKAKKYNLLLEWFRLSYYLENIDVKVEHWQVSSRATRSQVGVYTAGIPFARYDRIVEDFSERKLEKVINIANRILTNPTKDRIQKLAQDLTAETGFDEHLYFTD
jgi:hypothetical protein